MVRTTAYRISEVAARCGVSPRTIDYYTRQGLLVPVERSPGRQRYYDEGAVQRLLLIKGMQAERLTLREITNRLGQRDGAGSPSALAARLRSLEGELDQVNREIATLTPAAGYATDGREQQAVAQAASLVLAKTLALAQWLATVVRDGQPSPLG